MLKLKKKTIEPKAYAIELKSEDYNMIHLSAAYSLEEAMLNAKRYAAKKHSFKLIEWSLGKYTTVEINTLVEPMLENTNNTTIKEKNKRFNKNKLMSKIIETQDAKLFQQMLELLTEEEIQFINDKLRKKRKKI